MGASDVPESSNSSKTGKGSKDRLGRISSHQNMTFQSEASAFLDKRRSDYQFEAIPRTRPFLNSVLHLFGKWLFEAALGAPADTDSVSQARSVTMSDPSWHADIPSATLDDIEGNEAGRAEALGCLCRILSTIRTDEKVIPAYLGSVHMIRYFFIKSDYRLIKETSFNSHSSQTIIDPH